MRFSDGRNEVSDVVGISNCHLAEWLLCVQVFVLISDVMCNNISIRTSHSLSAACVQSGCVIFPVGPFISCVGMSSQ